MSLEAVLFDMDGLLVDSEPLWTQAEVELAARLGSVWTAEIKEAVVGSRLDVAVPRMLAMMGVDDGPAAVAATTEWLLGRMVELFRAELPLRPGALDLLQGLRAAGVPTALVSSSFRALVDAALEQLDRLEPDLLAVSVGGDEVARGKPDPEPYLLAARLLDADPRRCVVLEDSLTGVVSGEAAGCVCVAVPDIAPVPAAPGRHVLGSLAEADAAWLRSLVWPVPRPDVRGEHARLTALGGIDVDREPMSEPDVPLMFMLRDPDGNTVVVVEAPPA